MVIIDTKTIIGKAAPFNGKESEWWMWSRKFLDRASIIGYKGILLCYDKVLPLTQSKFMSKEEKEKLKGSLLAYADLILACKEPMVF